MLKKIVVVCSLIMLLGTAAVAAPAKGKFVLTTPIIGVNGLAWMGSGYDGRSFGDNGAISLFGTSQPDASAIGAPFPIAYAAPWSLGYLLTDNIEVGLTIGYVKFNDGSDSMLNLGIYGTYYLSTDKLMPFIKVGVIRWDVTDKMMGSETVISSSIGVAYAMSKTMAPFLSIDFNTMVDTGTIVNLTLGLKFMF